MSVSKDIIKQCQKGDEKAQSIIFKKYSSVLFGICLRYMKDRAKADDVMQDAFITIFTKINQFKGSGSFDGWVKRITINSALMQLRKNKKEFASEFIENIKQEEKEDKILDISNPKSVIENANFSQTEIFEALEELPLGYKTVFNLYVIDELKHKEIAKQLKISVGTSKSQLMRARKRLEELLYEKAKNKIKNQN